MLKGLAISPGYALGKAYCLKHVQLDNIPSRSIKENEVEGEITRFQNSLQHSRGEINQLLELPQIKSSLEIANIFQAHLALIDDPDLKKEVTKRIRERRQNLEAILSGVIKDYSEFFRTLPDPQFQGKAIDIMDIGRRIIKNCQTAGTFESLSDIDHRVIVVAEDLTPSEIVGFDTSKILGIATSEGTATSHASILARSLGIPALIQVKNLLGEVAHGSFLIIDGNTGTLVCNPQPHIIEEYHRVLRNFENQKKSLKETLEKTSVTLDEVRIKLCANIGKLQDVDSVIANNADGIGLYRTEFTYLIRRRFPTEEELLEIYSSVAERLKELELVIRTIDLGGDKIPHLLGPSVEKNPELGWRAVRMSLDRIDVFKTQLRAIVKTVATKKCEKIKILFPMISNMDELRRSKAILAEVCAELKKEGINVPAKIPIGAMIEVPSAALMSAKIAKEVDFLSIGSNDLVQYTLAVDRTNSKVAHLYQPTNPAVLRLLSEVIQTAKQFGKPVSICGELAGDSRYTLLLLGLGLQELSMNAIFIPKVKQIIRSISCSQARELISPILDFDTSEEIEKALQEINTKLNLQ